MRTRTSPGFSLVELSIVLVILGLLTGGILAGQSLIKAAELRSLSTEYTKYVAAYNAFRDKYFAWPGDMTNAQSFWGVQNATPATCNSTASTSALTCNGNGDGIIAWWSGSDETGRAWQHLANAGLIEGSYQGTFTTTAAINSYAPRSKFTGGGNNNWYIATFNVPFAGNTSSFATGDLGQVLYPSEVNNIYDLLPEQAWNIDTKMDDGKPATGRIIANKGDATYKCTDRFNQAVAAADQAANYNLSFTTVSCYLYFAKSF